MNFITQVIDADKVKSVSDCPGHFASIEIYKEDDKKKILADDRRKKEQAEQQRQDEEKRK